MKSISLRFVLVLLAMLVSGVFSDLAAIEERKVSGNGLDIYYRVFGKGEPLLILGGGPGDVSDRYLGLCELLAPVAQCILVEQRGTGKSTPVVKNAATISLELTLADFEAIRKQLALERWHVLGFSYGGWLASLYARKYPASVSSLVLLDSMGLDWNGFDTFEDNISSRLWPEDQEKVKYWSDRERLKSDYQKAVTEIIRAKMPGYFFDRGKALAAAREIKASDFDFEMGEFIYREVIDGKIDLGKLENNFKGPVLIIQGRQDPLGESVAMKLERYYPESRLLFVDKAGHYSWIEQPDEILKAVTGFLAGITPAGPDEGTETP